MKITAFCYFVLISISAISILALTSECRHNWGQSDPQVIRLFSAIATLSQLFYVLFFGSFGFDVAYTGPLLHTSMIVDASECTVPSDRADGAYTTALLEINSFISNNFSFNGLNVPFIILSLVLILCCIIISWVNVKTRVAAYHLVLQTISLLLLVVFSTDNLLIFYVAFEAILIPMFLLIGYWGSRDRKIHASYQFFLYTLIGSAPMLIALIYTYSKVGSLHMDTLLTYNFTTVESNFIWFAMFIAFAVKLPMVPVHIWLPEAHVEAPTSGSVLLAGILLKMGGFGLLKFSMPLFPEASVSFQTIVYLFSLLGILYSVWSTIRQNDLKKVIAYSSVGHMSYVTLGLISHTVVGITGGVMLMLGHGLVSAALFICVGSLYERYGSRVISYYGGLAIGMPIFCFFFLFFTLANVSLPGTSNFVGEVLTLMGVAQSNKLVAFLAALAIIPSAAYAFWLFNRVMFGRTRVITKFHDLTIREFVALFILFVLSLGIGFFPELILNDLNSVVVSVIEKVR